MQNLLQDLRFAFRVLRKSPGFTVAAILVLALGIGANTAIFSVVNAVLLRPLPFAQPDRVMRVWHTPPQKSFPGVTRFSVSPANFLDWQARNHAFESLAMYGFGSYNLTGSGEPRSLIGRRVTGDFFKVLAAEPLKGRLLNQQDDQPGQNRVAVLSESFWRTQFNADNAIVGKSIMLDGAAYAIVGVVADKYQFPIVTDAQFAPVLWTPMGMTPQERSIRGNHNNLVIGRLKPDASVARAQAELDTISRQLEKEYPADDNGWGAKVIPLHQDLVGEVRPTLLVLLGAVVFVLLIACANVANLVLARTIARQKEIAIRSALGATRVRVLRQVISETVLLSLVGGALGVLLALFALKTIVTTIASQLPRASEISLDAKVLAFTIALSLLAGVLAGLLPALRLSKTNVNDALKQGTRGGTEFGGNRTRSVLVTAEVALSLMLLVCAGLMLRSLSKLHNVDPGFDPKGVLAVIPAVSRTTFSGPAQQVGFFQQVLANARALPGVESAALADDLPMTGGSNQPIAIEGRPAQAMADQPEVSVRIVSPGYLKTMRIPVIRGRDFGTEEDAPNGTAILISEAMARRFWPNEDPVGKHLRLTFFPDRMREIVGVVGDIKDDGLNQPATAMLYTPFAQITAPPTEAWRSFPVWVVIRASGSPAGMLSSLNGAIHQVSAQMPILSSTTMDETVGQTLAQDRFTTMLLGAFAGLALFLAAIGIYSVLAYSVRRRVREIGIRMALGARLADVLRMVMIEGMKPTSVGLALGIAGSLALGRVLSTLIFGVKPTDLITFAGVSGLLLTVGLFACLLPAYRATQIQPMKTLRDE